MQNTIWIRLLSIAFALAIPCGSGESGEPGEPQTKPGKPGRPTLPMPMPKAANPQDSTRKTDKSKTAVARQPMPAMTESQKIATATIKEYLRRCTAKLSDKALADIHIRSEWEARRPELQRQLLDMLGLDPLPQRGDLKATVTGTVERPGIVVEKLHFQAMPGLYVTGNFYRPAKVEKPLPTILYLCGHSRVIVDGVACGNKTHYQHHGLWFARNGYCCLIIDSIQMGEIEGEHQGTNRGKMWWWVNRGYTPAGVEAWNSVRALDYLATRSEVDMKRIGVTGRSGGGIYSWWLAAIDDRPRCIAPVAGITDLENYVVDDCIEGHCDCMFLANAYGWDYPMVAALAAPRPVLFCNSDKDRIFPLTGVERSHAKLRRIYHLLGADDKLGLVVTEGPHKDTQELQVPVFRWMNRWLRSTDEPVFPITDPPIPPKELRVFDKLPSDEIVTKIHESFVAPAKIPPPPAGAPHWTVMREAWLKSLKEWTFRHWPEPPVDLEMKRVATKTSDKLVLDVYEYVSDENLRLPLYVVRGEEHSQPSIVVINVVDEAGYHDWLASCDRAFGEVVPQIAGVPLRDESAALQRKILTKNTWAFVTVPTRGIGPTQWNPNPPLSTHLARRFNLLGKTVDDGRVWDVRRAVEALDTVPSLKASRFWLQGDGVSAGLALYAGIYERRIERLDLHRLPSSHRDGPILFNVQRILDMPQAVALAFPKRVVLYDVDEAKFAWPAAVGKLVNATKSPLEFRKMPPAKATP